MENSGTIEIIDTSLVSTLVEDAINIDAISVNNDKGKIISVRDLTVNIVFPAKDEVISTTYRQKKSLI